RVHFPPTPGLCRTHLTHSSAIYDRHPIVVSPNACALPERNERTDVPCSEGTSSPRKWRSSHDAQGVALHPHAFTALSPAQSAPLDPTGRMPSLVPDLSSSKSSKSDVSSTPHTCESRDVRLSGSFVPAAMCSRLVAWRGCRTLQSRRLT
ncbi:hypothetical protein BC826DRAFT_1143631, partial [Russula brevipes]